MKKKILIWLLALVFVAQAFALNPNPEIYWGYAYLDSQLAPNGTLLVVETALGEHLVNQTLPVNPAFNGSYSISVPFDNPNSPQDEGADPNESIVWKTEQYMFKKFIDLGVNIVVDEVGVCRKYRSAYIPYAKKNKYKIIAVVLPRYSQEEAVNHRMKDPHGQNNRELWENVWNKFNSIYTEPTKEEGFDEIVNLSPKYMKWIINANR